MRILIPSHDTSLLAAMVSAYKDAGCEVVVGETNLPLRAAEFDVVHLQWPEALTDWRTPTREDLVRIAADLAWWRERSTIVGTVHNLVPHGRLESEMDRALFEVVYAACDIITHFSAYSRDELVRLHPSLAEARHLVHKPLLYSDLVPLSVGRAEARTRLGVTDGDFVIAVLGTLREAEELELVERGARLAKVRGKHPIIACRLAAPRRRSLVRDLLDLLPGRTRGRSFSEGRSSAEMVAVCEAADVLVIPRYPPHLNSGVMQMAMTFGTPLAVPAYGIYLEYLGDSGCEFYPPRDVAGLARAIERIAAQDHETLVARNRRVATGWGWGPNLALILEEVALRPHRASLVGENAVLSGSSRRAGGSGPVPVP